MGLSLPRELLETLRHVLTTSCQRIQLDEFILWRAAILASVLGDKINKRRVDFQLSEREGLTIEEKSLRQPTAKAHEHCSITVIGV